MRNLSKAIIIVRSFQAPVDDWIIFDHFFCNSMNPYAVGEPLLALVRG
jgi:hypothetical protein